VGVIMPIRKDLKHHYDKEWQKLARDLKDACDWCCQQCGARHNSIRTRDGVRIVVTVAHLNHVAGDNRPENLRVLCAGCHLRYDIQHHAIQRKRNARRKALDGQQLELPIE